MDFLVLPSILSIFLAGVAGVVRVRKIERTYFPFLWLLWVGCVNELFSIGLIHYGYQTIVNNNVYVLLEAFLILYFFRHTRLVLRHYWIYVLLCVSFGICWVVESLVMGSLYSISSYFRIYYSLVVVLVSIEFINALVFLEKGNLLRNPSFLIGMCFIFFFTLKLLVEGVWFYRLTTSMAFLKALFRILSVLNFIVNLVFFLVVLWIPKKQESLLSS